MNTLQSYRRTDLPWLVGSAAIYSLLTKIVLAFYAVHDMPHLFLPSAGLGLAVLLLGGMRFWPSIYIGALLGAVWAGTAAQDAAWMALINTLEPLIGAWLLTRKNNFSATFDSIRDFFWFFFLTAIFSPGICTLIGTGILLLLRQINFDDALQTFSQWWMAHALGIVLLTPLLLTWRHWPKKHIRFWCEMVAVLGLSFIFGQIIFIDWFSDLFGPISRGYWINLIICWAAIRLTLHGVVLITLMAVLQALASSSHSIGFFSEELATARIMNFWAYSLTLAITGMSLAIVFDERERITEKLKASENRYKSLFENMLDGLAHCRMIFQNGLPINFEFIAVNANYEKVSGLHNVTGKKISDVIPDYVRDNQRVLDAFATVVCTGIPARLEHYFADRNRWIALSIYRPAANEFICITENITERKQTADELNKLSLAITQSPVSIVITDLEARIQYVNPAFTRVSGYSAQEVMQQNPRILQSKLTPLRTYRALWQALHEGKTWRGEFINRRKDGSAYIEDAIISPLRQENGQISHYVGVKTDVTELKQVINQFRTSEERFLLAQQAANLGVYDYKIQQGHIAWDAHTWKFWGFKKDDHISIIDFMAGIHPADRASIRRVIDQPTPPDNQMRYQIGFRVINRIDHHVRHLMTDGWIFFENDMPMRAIGIFRDVSEQKRLEKEVLTQRSEMEQLVNQQVAAQTAAAIAHELNQPLVAVSVYSEAALRMLQANNPLKLQQALEGAIEQAQRAGRTLHELLDFLHGGEVVSESIDLNEVIKSALSLAEESGYGSFNAVMNLEKDLPPIKANRIQLQKVLLNLFHNGVDAMRTTGAPISAITITVKTMTENNMAKVTIRDNGPGLDAEAAQHIFDPFYTTKSDGIGLGLAISRSLIEAHGGRLWVDAKAKIGATFHFVLPFSS